MLDGVHRPCAGCLSAAHHWLHRWTTGVTQGQGDELEAGQYWNESQLRVLPYFTSLRSGMHDNIAYLQLSN